MEFKTGTGTSVVFEFVYKSFNISIADYTNCGEPENKISIVVDKHGKSLSSKTVERIAGYIQHRIKGTVGAYNGMLEVSLYRDDQFMLNLQNALDIIIPSA